MSLIVNADNFVRAETDTYFAGIQTPNAAASGVYGASRFYTASVESGHQGIAWKRTSTIALRGGPRRGLRRVEAV